MALMKVIKAILALQVSSTAPPYLLLFQRCRQKRKERGRRKSREGKRQRKSSDTTYSKGGNDEGRKSTEREIRLSETYNYLKLTSYGQ